MRQFFIKLALLLLPISLLVVCTNFFVDPANLFSSEQYVSGIADILARGHNVDKISNYDERKLQEQMLLKTPYTPDVAILGSSRIMEIGNDFFPGKRVLNLGVSHGNIFDLASIVGALDSLGKMPKTMVVNVDPSLISTKATNEWESISPYYSHFTTREHWVEPLPKVSEELYSSRKLTALLSFQYFKESVEFFFKGNHKQYADVGAAIPSHYGRFSDGTISYSNDYRSPDTFMVAKIGFETGAKEGLSDVDPVKQQVLLALIDFLKKSGVQVEFIMVPYHPGYYSGVAGKEPEKFAFYDDLYRKIAADNGIPVRGSFQASAVDVKREEFYDMYHCSKEAVKKAFNRSLNL